MGLWFSSKHKELSDKWTDVSLAFNYLGKCVFPVVDGLVIILYPVPPYPKTESMTQAELIRAFSRTFLFTVLLG